MKNVSVLSLFKDRKVKGSIILLSALTMMVFSFIRIPVLTTLHEYTVGMLLGWFGPFFYVYYIYHSLLLISNYRIEMPKWKNMTKYSYWFLIIAVVFIATTIDANKYTVIGYRSFEAFVDWFEVFTSSDNWLIPSQTVGGLLGTFMFSFVSMLFSGIGSIIISSVLLAATGSMLLTGSVFGLYLNLVGKKKKKTVQEAKMILEAEMPNESGGLKELNNLDFDDEKDLFETQDQAKDSFDVPAFGVDINNENPMPDEPPISQEYENEFGENNSENNETDELPFDDPFE